mmetsp:Transcript_15132/g.51054  ORF Transcript_15132/g.51054 Transcript_15132/m.51054 type:complete len:246 (+) Transcript_15132:489-1226(+)
MSCTLSCPPFSAALPGLMVVTWNVPASVFLNLKPSPACLPFSLCTFLFPTISCLFFSFSLAISSWYFWACCRNACSASLLVFSSSSRASRASLSLSSSCFLYCSSVSPSSAARAFSSSARFLASSSACRFCSSVCFNFVSVSWNCISVSLTRCFRSLCCFFSRSSSSSSSSILLILFFASSSRLLLSSSAAIRLPCSSLCCCSREERDKASPCSFSFHSSSRAFCCLSLFSSCSMSPSFASRHPF